MTAIGLGLATPFVAMMSGGLSRYISGSSAARQAVRDMFAAVQGGTRQTMLVLGDSTNAGRGAGTGSNGEVGARVLSPASVAAALWNARGIQSRADGWIGPQGISPNTAAHYAAYNPDVVFGANWAVDASSSLGQAMFSDASPNTDAIEFTPKRSADHFDILYPRGSGFAVTNFADSGGTLTGGSINMAGANAMLLGATSRVAASTTKITAARVSGGKIYVNGILPWNSTLAELSIVNAAAASWTVANYLSTANFYNAYYGIAAVAADMFYVELGLNEKNGGTTLATYLANLGNLIDYLVGLGGANSVILGISAPAQGGYNFDADWRAGIAAMAVTKDCVLVDHYSMFVAYDAAFYYDTVHLNAAGYARKGELLAALQYA
jgi:lysophospholipase L1-like esterase